jgi:MYXO-CTERM domain-containing protein
MKLTISSQTLSGLLFGLAASASNAALVTLPGLGFDVVYDDAILTMGQTAPLIQGRTIMFTPTQLKAESRNGQGLVSVSSSYSFVIAPHDGLFVQGISITERGDYLLRNASSWVSVAGQASATALGSLPLDTVSAALQASAAQPLNLTDGLFHDWTATAVLDMSGRPNFAQEADVRFSLDTTLQASTSASATGPRRAFIEKKFSGESITLSVATTPAVPEPETWALALVGLGVLGWGLRRR